MTKFEMWQSCNETILILVDALPEARHRIGPADGLKVELVDRAELGYALDVGGAPLDKVHHVVIFTCLTVLKSHYCN